MSYKTEIIKYKFRENNLNNWQGWATGLPGRLGKKIGIFPLKSRIKNFFSRRSRPDIFLYHISYPGRKSDIYPFLSRK